MPTAAKELPLLTVALGADSLPVGLPVLSGETQEAIFPDGIPAGQQGSFSLIRSGDWLIGGATAEREEALEDATQRLYAELIRATGTRELCRIWNYVPAINDAGPDGLENYRAFCRGRSLAFEDAWGSGFKPRLPAASAVGTDADTLAIVFAACTRTARHFENPLQVAAYDYPLEHGPRPPSFARATVVAHDATGIGDVFISGTAAIRGHHTIAPHDTRAQLPCTLENLRALGRACRLGDDLGAGRAQQRHLKVYVRHAADFPLVAEALEGTIVQPGDRVSYVRSDICRANLNLEIELTALGAHLTPQL